MSERDQDFEDARRGFIAALDPGRIEAPGGRVVWDSDAYDFLARDRPETATPSLWRQSRLTAIQGLFEIAPGFFQVRGLDLSNMEIVEGYDGIIVIDPLISIECAAAGLALYREHRGDRPVTAVVYTHSHVDHFGGVAGWSRPRTSTPGRCRSSRRRASSSTRCVRTPSRGRRWRVAPATCTGRCSSAGRARRSAAGSG